MKTHKLRFALLAGLLLTGCGDNADQQKETKLSEESKETKESAAKQTVRKPIEEAANLPPEVKKELMAAFQKHVAAFNAKDLEAYMNTISPQTRDLEEERQFVKKRFEAFDMKMEPQQTKIIKYDDKAKEAHFFIVMKSTTKDASSGRAVENQSRQIMQFKKEKDGWKQTALSAMQ
ncbi:YybH family protein [Bacillus xiapuensis]|uniref:YybH family protein n=1 Tax=Bacillus xiapuensis TaxID=2014075 RepID=UPI000C2347D1|nr:hypothetical protein [Bacillus xiapuensis]